MSRAFVRIICDITTTRSTKEMTMNMVFLLIPFLSYDVELRLFERNSSLEVQTFLEEKVELDPERSDQ